MSGSQNYGVLRVVRVRFPADTPKHLDKYPAGLFPEERLVYVLKERETTIGRALSNDLILMDPSVSREHARLIFNGDSWSIHNVTEQNLLHVNGKAVSAGAEYPLQSQDFLVMGNTMLQLIAPRSDQGMSILDGHEDEIIEQILSSQIHPKDVAKDPNANSTRYASALESLPHISPTKKTPAINGKNHNAHTLSPETSTWLSDQRTAMEMDARAWAEEGKFLGGVLPWNLPFLKSGKGHYAGRSEGLY
ncbi:FHA domain-containing protein [Dictyobacter kobayashii]|uniref:FHA domain-containing protein n=1 Tax=Dictyobacter kobayashii TaxID=2014872 RepID=A0A402AMU5_9CHLR|nr:FHA domain-containing protein [Dictyobacter kobayashii]GCE20320.1 hypothetical protein KDK_41200 [Dictyobacter kobayashii]